MTTKESRGAGGPGDMEMNDEVALLVRLADRSGPTAPLDPPNEDRLARVRTAVHGAWRDECVARQVKSRRRRLMVAVPLIAASLVIAVAIWSPSRTPAPAPVLVAHIDQVTGHIAGSSASFAAGGALMSGSTVTTSAGTLAMTLTSGVHLRLDASSIVRLDSVTDVTIERGALYVDSADAQAVGSLSPGASPITIHTPSGIVRDIGTQFEVRLAGTGTRIRVRDGQVRVTNANGVDVRAVAGEELFSKPDGSSIGRRPIAVTGSEWAWAERAAPPFSLEGKTLGALLDWVSREGAWTMTFADSTLSETARATMVHARPDLKGLTPAEALDIVLPICGLRHRMDGRRVVIEQQPRAGATR